MTDTFNNLPRKDISLDQVRELPEMFERVVDSQKTFDLLEAKKRLITLERELEASDMAIREFQQSLAEKVIATGQVDNMDQSRGMILVAHRNELLAEQEILKESIERTNELQVAIGHLAVAHEIIVSLNDRYVVEADDTSEEISVVGSLDIPIVDTKPTTTVELPELVVKHVEVVDSEVPLKYERKFKSKAPPSGVRGLRPIKATQ